MSENLRVFIGQGAPRGVTEPRVKTRHVAHQKVSEHGFCCVSAALLGPPALRHLLQSFGMSPCRYILLVSGFMHPMLSDSAFKVNGYIRI